MDAVSPRSLAASVSSVRPVKPDYRDELKLQDQFGKIFDLKTDDEKRDALLRFIDDLNRPQYKVQRDLPNSVISNLLIFAQENLNALLSEAPAPVDGALSVSTIQPAILESVTWDFSFPTQDLVNIAQLPYRFLVSSGTGPTQLRQTFSRIPTLGDGACGIHALFGTRQGGQLACNKDLAKATILSMLDSFNFDLPENSELKAALVSDAKDRSDLDGRPVFPIDYDSKSSVEQIRLLITHIGDCIGKFNTHSELLLFAKLMDKPVILLHIASGRNDAKVMEQSPCSRFLCSGEVPIYVAHSGGAHWERWELR